jgi:hypothetical protein
MLHGHDGLAEEVYEFRVGRATTDMIFEIIQMIEKTGNMEKSFQWYSLPIINHMIV